MNKLTSILVLIFVLAFLTLITLDQKNQEKRSLDQNVDILNTEQE